LSPSLGTRVERNSRNSAYRENGMKTSKQLLILDCIDVTRCAVFAALVGNRGNSTKGENN
jgi:hypothetical protein